MNERILEWVNDRWNFAAGAIVVSLLLLAWGFTFGVVSGRVPFSNSAASLVATTITVTLTGFYAIMTFSLLRESIRDRHQRVAPTIVLDSGGSNMSYGPVVRNVGNGPAIDLTIHAKLHPNGPEEVLSGQNLRVNEHVDLGFLNDAFGALGVPDAPEYQEYNKIVVEVEFDSNTGKEYSHSREKKLSVLQKERGKAELLR